MYRSKLFSQGEVNFGNGIIEIVRRSKREERNNVTEGKREKKLFWQQSIVFTA